jgi:hypothetical protein
VVQNSQKFLQSQLEIVIDHYMVGDSDTHRFLFLRLAEALFDLLLRVSPTP